MEGVAQLSLGTAILIGLWEWLAHAMIPSSHLFWNALTTSVWVGFILGDIPTAVVLGASIELVFLGSNGFVGGVSLQDECVATLIAVPAIMTSGLDLNAAVALVIPVGLVFAQVNNLGQALNSIINRIAEWFIAKHRWNGVYFCAYGMPFIVRLFIKWIPITAMIYLGSAASSALASMMPEWLNNGLTAVGSCMPAVGFGIILYVMGVGIMLPFMLAGFFLMQYTGLSAFAATMVGAFLAFLYYLFAIRGKADSQEEPVAEEVEREHILTKKDRNKTQLLWFFFSISCESWELKQGLDFGAAMLPSLKKLYKDEDELEEAMNREIQFFNTETQFGACCPGIALAMEEAKAMGEPVTGNMITATKTSLMGPFAGIGDSITWGLLYFLIMGLCIPGAMNGNAFAAVMPPIVFGIISFFINRFMFNLGYRTGTDSAAALMKNGMFSSMVSILTVMGMFMVGALSASYVTVTTPIVITLTTGSMPIQGVLDGIVPGILPLCLVFLSYGITKKYKKFLITALTILIGGIILGCLGIIA